MFQPFRIVIALIVLSFPLSVTASESARVAAALSGNRILLEDGRTVRYIGVGIPGFSIECRDVGQQAQMSLEYNRNLVEHKEIKIVYDKRIRTSDGVLLAYVYVDTVFVNAEILSNGLALVETDPRNSRYTEYFKKLLRQAKKSRLGFWKPQAIQTPLPFPRWNKPQPAEVYKPGQIVFTQPGDPYYYPRNHPNLRAGSKAILIENAIQKGLKPAPKADPK